MLNAIEQREREQRCRCNRTPPSLSADPTKPRLPQQREQGHQRHDEAGLGHPVTADGHDVAEIYQGDQRKIGYWVEEPWLIEHLCYDGLYAMMLCRSCVPRRCFLSMAIPGASNTSSPIPHAQPSAAQ